MSDPQVRSLNETPWRRQGEMAPQASASDKALPLRDVRILVTDDDALSLEVTRLTLMSRGAQVDVAASGLVAIEKTASVAYDALLIDERMPGMLGSEAIERIRARPDGNKVCIVAMVSRTDAAASHRVLAAGANGWLAKPVSPRHLLGTISQCLGARSTPRPDLKQERVMPQVPQEFAELDSLDVSAAISRLGGNAGLYRQTLFAFIRGHADAVAEIRASLLKGDATVAHRQTHTLKGICGTIGAMSLLAQLQALENDIVAGATPEPLLEAVDALMPGFHVLVDDVRRYAAAYAASDPASSLVPLSPSQISKTFHEIKSLLESDDASAARVIEKFVGRAKPQFPSAAWEPFVTYGLSYDFEKALQAMTGLERSLNLEMPSGD